MNNMYLVETWNLDSSVILDMVILYCCTLNSSILGYVPKLEFVYK
jgi:hypothetical protein